MGGGIAVTPGSPWPPRNRLLARLSPEGLARLAQDLQSVDVPRGETLYGTGEQIRTVWFPDTAVLSHRVSLSAGEAVEIATIGREGMVGHAVFLGDSTSELECLVQVPGRAWGVSADAFCQNLERDDLLRRFVGRSMRAFFLQVAQVAACNRLHDARQRLARWLLMTHDRVGADVLPLTHEFLAEMIGATRTTATLTLRRLQEDGLVRTGHSQVTVCDRPGLEQAACECYEATREYYERLLGAW